MTWPPSHTIRAWRATSSSNYRTRARSTNSPGILIEFAGKTRTVRDIFEAHGGDGRFIEKNYKEALRRLEAGGRVAADPPASARERRKGKATAGHVAIGFPTA